MNIQTNAVATLLAGAVLLAGHAGADMRDFQMQLLFEPAEQQLAMEQRGRVMIYDGLRDSDVQRAMDQQFDRIESMMFVGTVITRPSGEPVRNTRTGELAVEDDGC